MSRKLMGCLAISVLLLALVSCGGLAQTNFAPTESGVRGSGVIQLTNTGSIIQFDINVTQSSSGLLGGLKFIEYSSNSTVSHVVVSREIKKLSFPSGNVAAVTAIGYWNRSLAEIRVEALDDLAGDNIRITARPIGTITESVIAVIYDRQGGVVKGDIVVFRKPQITRFAKGYGTFLTKDNVAQFEFYAQATPVGVEGKLNFAECKPMVSSVSVKPIVQITMPKVASFKLIDPMTAVIEGKGTLNGQPAKVVVTAIDYYNPLTNSTIFRPDWFAIRATALNTSRTYTGYYYAAGSLTKGDIVVGTTW